MSAGGGGLGGGTGGTGGGAVRLGPVGTAPGTVAVEHSCLARLGLAAPL